MAAAIARHEVDVAILLLDPSDPWIDAVETRALKRVCIQLQTRLITTYAAAGRWLLLEAHKMESSDLSHELEQIDLPLAKGTKNIKDSGEPRQLRIEKRTIALISHDKKKLEMVEFANANAAILARHERILTTGTTGTLLKLLLAAPRDEESIIAEASDKEEERLSGVLLEILKSLEIAPLENGLGYLLNKLRQVKDLERCPDLAERIVTMPSGPLGGDVLIAEAVLHNECHSIIFFHDPLTAHPHNDDIRLLEHTSQLPGVFAECVSDKVSAEKWIEGLRQEEELHEPLLSSLLRERCESYGLRDVVVVPRDDDKDCPDLGLDIARAAAGYFHQMLCDLLGRKERLRIGIAWGWGAREVLKTLEEFHQREFITKPSLEPGKSIVWSPLIGSVGAELTGREASVIAEGFCGFYGGTVDAFHCAGFALKEAQLPGGVTRLMDCLEKSDLILTSGAPWGPSTGLIKDTGLSERYFPAFAEADGLVSGVFLRESGEEVIHKYGIIGLGYEGFRKAAERGTVILMCGGEERRRILLGAIRAKMISTLVTTSKTARWLADALI